MDCILIGRHVPLKYPDYLLGSAKIALEYGSNSLMIYIGSPRSSFRVLTDKLKIKEFKEFLNKNCLNINNVIVHSSYLVNLGNFTNNNKNSWYISFLEKDIKVMEEIGLKTLVMHPGSSLGLDKNLSLLNVSKSLNQVLEKTSKVRIAIETMSGRKNELGSNFEEIKFIIDNVKFKDRIGVCWDTCHLYSSGYDIKNNLDGVIEEFKNKIGLEKMWVIHLNDSSYGISSNKDRHANIGYGSIGFESLKKIVHNENFKNVIKILETPTKNELHKNEIRRLLKI